MTLDELIYDIREIKNALEDDSDLRDEWLLYKINAYRSILIPEQYRLEPVINPAWLQSLPMFSFTMADAADDPSITVNSITLGRAELPAVVFLPEDQGLYRLSGSGGIIGFEQTDFDTLVMKAVIKEEMPRNFGYYARVGNFAYVYPYIMEGKAIVIAEDPTSIQVHTGTAFRDFALTDEYPLDGKTAQAIVLQILTVDLKLDQQSVVDIINDSQDQLNIMKDAVVPKRD